MTAVASDSTHSGAFDQNIFTEYHNRYGGRGVLIYWHVERKSMAIHSQLINCSASEVPAMVDGAIRHGTSMQVEGNYVDTRGRSEIGFGITRLLGFELLPRIKRIDTVRLYRPAAGESNGYPYLAPAMVNRTIRWELIAQQYDQMIRYATAIRTGTASAEAILRRFAKTNAMHPTYQAVIEVGRAQKTLFAARYLRNRDLQREIIAGSMWSNRGTGATRSSSLAKEGTSPATAGTNKSCRCCACGSCSALMLQDVLADDEWTDALTVEDRRGLTPLFWAHVAPYGEVKLDMTSRLRLSSTT